jgi:hypothetical protein
MTVFMILREALFALSHNERYTNRRAIASQSFSGIELLGGSAVFMGLYCGLERQRDLSPPNCSLDRTRSATQASGGSGPYDFSISDRWRAVQLERWAPMRRHVCFLSVALVSACAAGSPVKPYRIETTGSYYRDGGGEYESAFSPCSLREVWHLEGGAAYEDLVHKYGTLKKNKHQGILVTLQLNVTPIDKTEYPNSHKAAIASVERIVSFGNSADVCMEAVTQ